MGFYTKGEYYDLPNKRVVDDLLDRDGPPNEESFTPFNGMNYLIKEQMVGDKWGVVDIGIIKADIEEVFYSKLKGKQEYTDKSSSDDLSSDMYETILENIDEEYLKRYISMKLSFSKIHNTGIKSSVIISNNVQPTIYDKETGEVFNISDVYVEDREEGDYELTRRMRERIPYLLKKLQDGSIIYGISLLSLFMAKDGVMKISKKDEWEIRPRDLLVYDIYEVSSNGMLLGKVNPENANNTKKFRDAKDVIMGINPNSPYYKAGEDLIAISNELGYNLYEEDILDYDGDSINNLMCSYIMSNYEVLSDMAFSDPTIMRLFEDGSIFDAPTLSNDGKKVDNRNGSLVRKLREMAKGKSFVIPNICDIMTKNKIIISKDPVKLINQFLYLYNEHINSHTEFETFDDCTTEYNTLYDFAFTPIVFKMDMFVHGFGDTPGFGNTYCIIGANGLVVKIDNILNKAITTTLDCCINYFITKDINCIERVEYTI